MVGLIVNMTLLLNQYIISPIFDDELLYLYPAPCRYQLRGIGNQG